MTKEDIKVGKKYYVSYLVEWTQNNITQYTERKVYVGECISNTDIDSRVLMDISQFGLEMVNPKAVIDEVKETKKWWEFWK